MRGFRCVTVVRNLWVGVVVLLAACSPPPPPTPDAAALTATVVAEMAAAVEAEEERLTAQAAQISTDVAGTLTAQPTSTPTETHTPTPEPTETHTPEPTATHTPAATPTATRTTGPTAPPVTVAPTSPPVPASVYSAVGGPQLFETFIDCTRNGAQCTPEMAPGDVAFDFYLASEPTAPWALFVPYGLSVEKDGANIANMFMFVDAGFLEPGTLVRFGASRNFTSPGRYVIRSNGCMTTSEAPCGWTTMSGTVVTFVIK